MDRNMFLRLLRNNPGWENMIQKGSAGITVFYKNVEFLILGMSHRIILGQSLKIQQLLQ